MKGYKTISAILSDAFLIHPAYAISQLSLVTAIMEGKHPVLAQQAPAEKSAAITSSATANIGVLNITGPVFKYDGACGEPGYLSYGEAFSSLVNNSAIDVIVLNIDSPGGQAAGLRTFAQQIKASPKKTIAYINDGYCASAAYWIASQCDWIIASQPTDLIGSIGAYQMVMNYVKAAENQGVPLIEVYSNLSSEKNLPVREALEGRPELLKAELDQLVTVFIQDVQAARAGRIHVDIADPFKGMHYVAQSSDGSPDALSIGLIDEIGTMDAVKFRANEFTQNPNDIPMAKFAVLAALAGKPAADVPQATLDQVNAELTEAGITEFGLYPESAITAASEISSLLEASEQAAVVLREDLETANTALATQTSAATTANARVAELEGELTAAQTTIADLEGKVPAGGNDGKGANSNGDNHVDGPQRELTSWEQKAKNKVARLQQARKA